MAEQLKRLMSFAVPWICFTANNSIKPLSFLKLKKEGANRKGKRDKVTMALN
jgi:hypothetical protein